MATCCVRHAKRMSGEMNAMFACIHQQWATCGYLVVCVCDKGVDMPLIAIHVGCEAELC